MIRNLFIDNFRSFKHLELRNLGRVNLLVGTNNSGKTSVLEAVQLAASRGDEEQFVGVARSRGEFARTDNRRLELAIRHLFHGHELNLGSSFSITMSDGEKNETCTVRIVRRESARSERSIRSQEPDSDSYRQLTLLDEPTDNIEQATYTGLAIKLQWTGPENMERELRLTRRGSFNPFELERSIGPRRKDTPSVASITTAALSAHQVARWFNRVVLTSEEEHVLEALKTIEPSIERIAAISAETEISSKSNIVVKCRGIQQRIPIGSMGDGTWRMLGLALALAHAENGILLVDEIDTGLHYTVMDNMWKMIRKTAERLNVQVFATSHSRDCFESLAVIASETISDHSDVTIQRVERNQEVAVSYNEQEIVVAARRGLEVR